MTREAKPFDAARFFTTRESQAELLAEAFEGGHAGYITQALGTVARARGMSDVARGAGVTREALYKALSGKGDPKLSTLLGIARALGLQLTVARAAHDSAAE